MEFSFVFFSLLFASGGLLLWRWLTGSSSSWITKEGLRRVRPLGCFEYVMYQIVRGRGCHNIVLVLSFSKEIDEELLRKSLDKVQNRHDLLRARVIDEGLLSTWFEVSPPLSSSSSSKRPGVGLIPLIVSNESLPKSSESNSSDGRQEVDELQEFVNSILAKEVNLGFEALDPLVRLKLFRLRSEKTKKDLVALTIRHDSMDGKSAALLGAEIFEIYAELASTSPSSSSSSTSSSEKEEPREELAPPIDVLLPQVPKFLIFILHLFRYLKVVKFCLTKYGSLPVTSDRYIEKLKENRAARAPGGKPLGIDQPLWGTSLQRFELDEAKTALLMKKCKENNVSVGCVLYSAISLATALESSRDKNPSSSFFSSSFGVWGIMIADMRAAAVIRRGLNPRFLGNYVSTFDFMETYNLRHEHNLINNKGEEEEKGSKHRLWKIATRIKKELNSEMRSGYNLTSLLFAQYLTGYGNYYSSNFSVPFPCPGFSFSNLGSLDSRPSSISLPPSSLPSLANVDPSSISSSSSSPSSPSLPSATATVAAIAGNFLPDLIESLSERVGLEEVNAAVSSSTSWPFPQLTTLTHRRKIKFSLCFPSETMDPSQLRRYSMTLLKTIDDGLMN